MQELIIGKIYTRDTLESVAKVQKNILVYKTKDKNVRSGNFNEKYKITNIIDISDCQIYDFVKSDNDIGIYNKIIFTEIIQMQARNEVDISEELNNIWFN